MTPDHLLWYTAPAKDWEMEALPIGNGRLGGMVFGGVPGEHVQFNEDSLWLGDEKDTGSYQAFGDLFIDLAPGGAVSDYRRSLDLNSGIAGVSYRQDGADYRREAFSSAPDQVMALRLATTRSQGLEASLRLTDAHPGQLTAEGHDLVIRGALANGLRYEARARVVLPDGGTFTVNGGSLQIKNAPSLVVLLAAHTDFLQDRAKKWRGADPHLAVARELDAAEKESFDDLRSRSVADYRKLYDRVTLDVGASKPGVLAQPTDARIAAYAKGGQDPQLESLLFQYGRYLLISSSRPGSAPANLQGIWNNSNNPPWRCDFHSDINIEMNYWPSDVTGLPECFLPFASYLQSTRAVHHEATQEPFPGARGWTLKGENGLFGGMSWLWVNSRAAPGNARICGTTTPSPATGTT